jgi:hypothetical protein
MKLLDIGEREGVGVLLRLRLANFRSLRDEAELSLVPAHPQADPEQLEVAEGGLAPPSALRVAGIFGANASGKSNVLEAVKFLQQAVISSHAHWLPNQLIPRRAFCLDDTFLVEPTMIEVDFIVDGVRTQYGFEVSDKEVVSEWLYQFPFGKRRKLFERDFQNFSFGETLSGRKRLTADITRPNSLFLSAAATANVEKLRTIFNWFANQLSVIAPRDLGSSVGLTMELLKREESARQVNTLLQMADLGIVSASVATEDLTSDQIAQMDRVLEKSGGQSTRAKRAMEIALREVYGTRERVLLAHASPGGERSIEFEDESLGTRTWFSLIGHLVRALQRSSTLFVDELDASLHPVLISETLKLFEDPRLNRRGAQLVFTSHDTTPLGKLSGFSLKRDQVWLVEKGREGVSTLIPMTDYRPRKDENLQRGYLQGRYGAVPRLAWHELLHEQLSWAAEG